MPPDVEALVALLIAAAVTGFATPLMSRLAQRVGILDHPVGYKRHERSTPYLGGIAILLGTLAAFLVTAGASSPVPVIAAAAVAICLLGTLDDLRPTSPVMRMALHAGVGVFVWQAGVGWSLAIAEWANLVLTVGWVVLATNVFNLIDNLDGTSGGAAVGSALGITAIALIDGPAAWPALLAAAVLGSCLGFLPFNLAKPARIFLGDGGSNLLGFLLAVAVMGALPGEPGSVGLVAAALLVGAPLIDTALTLAARHRRGVPLLDGGRDHVTHRIHSWLGSTHRTAAVVGVAQIGLSALAVAAVDSSLPVIGWALGVFVLAVPAGIFVWRGGFGRPTGGPLSTMRRAG
jgi:UDP-GlcNAc:undecaprenyl-phosphate/decaprenyl-phosphate GlcNAc-1-phosphate transferase